MKSLFIFESHPVQYHAPVYRALHQLCAPGNEAKIHVFYGTKGGHFDPGFGRAVSWDEPLLEGYPVTVLNNGRGDSLRGCSSLSGRGVAKLLHRERPDVILLTKLRHAFDWTAYTTALLLGIPIWLRMETQDEAFARSRFKTALRSIGYRIAYAPVKRAFMIGRLNSAHYTRHGIPAARQTPSRYCVVDRFADFNTQEKNELRAAHRRSLKLPEETALLLFCGKLQAKKNPDLILEALARLSPQARSRFAVLFIGTGEREENLRQQAARMPEISVTFAGFKNQSELAPWYLASDVLVLPSQQMGETWGLVANEALLAERRVVLSRHCGSQEDFKVLPSVRVFDGTANGLAEVLRNLPSPNSTAGQRDFMSNYSIQAAAEGIACALGVVPAEKPRPATPALPTELNLVSAH